MSNFRDEDGHKMDNISLSDDFGKQIESDEDSMGEYGGDLDISKFNEDGSINGGKNPDIRDRCLTKKMMLVGNIIIISGTRPMRKSREGTSVAESGHQ